MTRATIAGAALVVTVLVLSVGAWWGYMALTRLARHEFEPAEASVPPTARSTPGPAPLAGEAHQGFLYGRVNIRDGTSYEGRLRFGGTQEAFWGDYFNGYKDQNPWKLHVPPEQLTELQRIEILGVEIVRREREIDLGRPFMARLGDVTRVEAEGRDLRVTLKSGTVFHLDRLGADDLADGVRVWDRRHGVVDLHEIWIRSIEFLSTAGLRDTTGRLYGTLRTAHTEFTGFVQWDRDKCVGRDELKGQTAEGELSLRFDTIRSIARHSEDGVRVTRFDGREVVFSEILPVDRGHRGVYVDDPRYGRVLVSWEAFERLDLSSAGSGPAYTDFPPGRPLTGSVSTRAGRRLTGRLVYDLDESETTETLDAPSRGVNYTIPFGLIASIVPLHGHEGGVQFATVILHGGEELELVSRGDLGEGNAGMLIFADGRPRPEYVPWADVVQIELDRPRAMYPPASPDVAP